VLSFRGMDPADPAAVTASGQAGVGLTTPLYRVEVFLHGAPRPHPTDLARKHVPIRRRVELLVDPLTVLAREQSGPWRNAT
jgi:hypothetical protein